MATNDSEQDTFSRRAWRKLPILGKHPFRAGVLFVVLCCVGLLLPSPYVIESPGPTLNVLGKVDGKPAISVSGGPTHQDTGKLLMTTVNAAGIPSAPVMNWESLLAWLRPDRNVLPREMVFPAGQTGQEYNRLSLKQMSGAQSAAQSQAFVFLHSRGVDTQGIKISMGAGDVGGPSAGLMFTLGLIDKLTPTAETGGQVIAGTGTMNSQGQVGAIGGIQLKMLGARRDGATWFLAPEANCDEVVGHVPAGLRDVKVSTLAQAYDALVAIGKGQGADLPHCSASQK